MTELSTREPPGSSDESIETSEDALVDGINVDAVARAVQACAGVSGLHGGRFAEMASYLRGRRVPGVVVTPRVVTVQITARWGVPVRDLRSQIMAVLRPLVDRRIDIVVADIDDPPSTADARPAALESGALESGALESGALESPALESAPQPATPAIELPGAPGG